MVIFHLTVFSFAHKALTVRLPFSLFPFQSQTHAKSSKSEVVQCFVSNTVSVFYLMRQSNRQAIQEPLHQSSHPLHPVVSHPQVLLSTSISPSITIRRIMSPTWTRLGSIITDFLQLLSTTHTPHSYFTFIVHSKYPSQFIPYLCKRLSIAQESYLSMPSLSKFSLLLFAVPNINQNQNKTARSPITNKNTFK